MARKTNGNLLGSWAFVIGVILALVIGFFGPLNVVLVYVLMTLGVLVGLLNIADKEATPFLMAGTVLVIVSAFGQSVVGVAVLAERLLQSISIMFVPATIVVALKHVFGLARH